MSEKKFLLIFKKATSNEVAFLLYTILYYFALYLRTKPTLFYEKPTLLSMPIHGINFL